MFKFKKDKYASNRGGKSVLLDISCGHCKIISVFIRKMARGPLKRMYCDRIVSPASLVDEISEKEFKDLKPLHYHSCNNLIAIPMIYEKENRNAFRFLWEL